MIVGVLIQKIGKKKSYILGLVLIGVVPLIRLIDVRNIPILMAATAVTGFASGLCMPLTYGIQADNTDYVEVKMGYPLTKEKLLEQAEQVKKLREKQ